jgi:hypothetical protein
MVSPPGKKRFPRWSVENYTIRFKEISARPPKEKPLKPFKIKNKYIPPKNHPWRKHSSIAKNRTFLLWRKQDISILV